MKRGQAALAAALCLAALGTTARARAYCLTHGCNPQTEDCTPDDRGCIQAGPLLHWESSCVSFALQKDGSVRRGIDYDAAHDTLVQAFKQWLNADCGGRGPSIEVSDFGPVECHTPEYNQDAPNANVVMFRDEDWPYSNAVDTLALTTLIFDAETGAIFDADIEVNTFQNEMTTGRVGPRDVDLHSVLTHEVGHFLGLSHSDVALSTMEASYSPGLVEMATIAFDDQKGICAALPPDRATTADSCEPRHGFSSECALPTTSCALPTGAPSGWSSALFSLLVLSSGLGRRKLRRAAPRP